ncbi:phage tail sheath family protein [Nostoc sp. LEGE 12447]|uniref:phage tail sheath subtilisin-like domain-containing protein n=1 Tax=Nostoc sp. LEGE 12447 TaxID=1828640 RepID=UPI001687DF58|nr:phage tail sheath subtilisin-like domain-containing protein [Nostoc sp. LEGE 12447]MBD2511485.1 phage tail sheath family protein [Desmonostoc muscorum FACHB-395]MBE9001885.1 phage tail sheath family protein [Nostoc sp. LEGE 12447]
MPTTPTYPGVYIEEIPSGVRTITGVATSITAFIGRALRGPTDEPITINSYSDFERIFGGLWVESSLGYAVRDFYLNGGSQAIIVRLYEREQNKEEKSPLAVAGLTLKAAYQGRWGENLRATVDVEVSEAVAKQMGLNKTDLFNLTIRDLTPGGTQEKFLNLAIAPNKPRSINKVLENESKLVRCTLPNSLPTAIADAHTAFQALINAKQANPPVQTNINNATTAYADAVKNLDDDLTKAEKQLAEAKKADPQVPGDIQAAQTAVQNATNAKAASNGVNLIKNSFSPPETGQTQKEGLYALEKVDLFNLLCIPPYIDGDPDVDSSLIAEAAAYCEKRRAFLIVDAPKNWRTKDDAKNNIDNVGTRSNHAAVFFPRLKQPNPLLGEQIEDFAPCGAVAGIFARTDAQRGIWKAPAGLETNLVGVPQLSVPLTDPENGELNPLGINCLRAFPGVGRIVWGARTLQGDDRFASEWKYIPVRRTALYIEESLYRGTQWVVFEPNDEPLWAQIRLNIGAFMNNLFRQGAFQGRTPQEAYFVKCSSETTTQNDINLGIVNIVVGFAPLKPAEFVIIKIQQIAGQIAV